MTSGFTGKSNAGSLPVARSVHVGAVFFTTAAITVLIMLWLRFFRAHPDMMATTMSPIYYFLFASLDYGGTLAVLAVLLGALFLSARGELVRIPLWVGSRPIAFAVTVTATLLVGAVVVYQRFPLSMDEYTVLFQSEVFASGHLTGQFPPSMLPWLVPPDHGQFFMTSEQTGAIASSYWPSFAVLLAPFTWAGVPWALNPVLSGVTLIVVHRLAVRLLGTTEAGGMAMLLTMASPVFLADGISYYTMTAHMLANGIFALLLLDPSPRRAFLAGIVGSIALTLHNPLPHLLFALPWGVWLATRPGAVKNLASIATGYLPLSVVLGLGWRWMQQHFGLAAASAGPYSVSAGALFGLPSDLLLLARLIGLAKLWLWAVPGILLLAGMGVWRWRKHTGVMLIAASAITTFVGFLFAYVEQGHGWGFRYFHSAWLALPILAAAALTPTASKLTAGGDVSLAERDMRSLAIACALLTLVISVPLRGFQMQNFIAGHRAQLPAYAADIPRVEFINPKEAVYGLDLLQNDPFLRGNLIRLLPLDEKADALMLGRFRPTFHRVYADRYGQVWADVPAASSPPTAH